MNMKGSDIVTKRMTRLQSHFKLLRYKLNSLIALMLSVLMLTGMMLTALIGIDLSILKGSAFDQSSASLAYGKTKKTVKVTKKEINRFLRHSVLVGNSIQIRRRNYFNRKPKGYLGKPKFMVHQGYSAHSDFALNSKWCLHYRGTPIHLWDYIKREKGIKYVFIQLGTNDLQVGVTQAYKNIKKLVAKVRSKNPKVIVFVESTFPCHKNLGKHLTPKTIKHLNKKLKRYIKSQRKVYWIYIQDGKANKKGRMKKIYAEDATHPNTKGVKKWNSLTVEYVRTFIRNNKLGIGNEQGKKYSKAKKELKIIFWDKKEHKLYFNNGKNVTGICVFKKKLYAMTKTGKYRKTHTKKIRAAAKKGNPIDPLIELLGKPKKVTHSDSCLELGGTDGIYNYKHFYVTTYRPPDGEETVQGVQSVY